MKLNNRTIMAVPRICFFAVIATCIIGIIIGSIWDFQISALLANKTEIGAFFATYGSYFSYCLYPAAGVCLFVGFKKKGQRFHMIARAWPILGFFMAV